MYSFYYSYFILSTKIPWIRNVRYSLNHVRNLKVCMRWINWIKCVRRKGAFCVEKYSHALNSYALPGTSDCLTLALMLRWFLLFVISMKCSFYYEWAKRTKLLLTVIYIRVERFFKFFEFVLVIVEKTCPLMRK